MAFDLMVEHRDPKTGRVVKVTPYTRWSTPEGVVYLRDGVFYTESGQIASDQLVESIAGRDALSLVKKPEATKK